MTDTAPTTIEARSNAGSGLLTPLLKTLCHISIVHAGATRDNEEGTVFPMTAAEAHAELRDAATHIITAPGSIMTDGAIRAISDWQAALNETITWFSGLPALDRINTEASISRLQNLIAAGWNLTAVLDIELTGLGEGDSDPGRLP